MRKGYHPGSFSGRASWDGLTISISRMPNYRGGSGLSIFSGGGSAMVALPLLFPQLQVPCSFDLRDHHYTAGWHCACHHPCGAPCCYYLLELSMPHFAHWISLAAIACEANHAELWIGTCSQRWFPKMAVNQYHPLLLGCSSIELGIIANDPDESSPGKNIWRFRFSPGEIYSTKRSSG